MTDNLLKTPANDDPGKEEKAGSARDAFWSVLATNMLGFRRRPHSLRIAVLRRMKLGSWSNRLALILMIAAVAAGFATYAAMNAAPPFGNDPNTVLWLLNIDLIIMLFLVTLIARRIVSVWSGRKKGVAGSRLHVRLVFIFGILAAAPAIIMTIFAAFFLHFGVQSWFNDRVRTAVNESQAVAEAYLSEHMQVIRADTMAMAYDIDRQANILLNNAEAFAKVMQTQSMLRNLPEAVIFNGGEIIFPINKIPESLEMDTIPAEALNNAREGDVVIMTGGQNEDKVRALVSLRNFGPQSYLLVGRGVDPVVLSHVRDTRKAVKEYERLEGQRSGLQVKITMIFLVVALLLLFAAIWFGLMFSRQLVVPISALISAADRVREGDLSARVPAFERKDEFDVLGVAFNRMTSQIAGQREELVAANRQLDERRRFIETVLSGVSSGVIGIDESDRIALTNNAAAELFGAAGESLAERQITGILPGLRPLLLQARQKPGRIAQAEIPYVREDGSQRTLLVRIVADQDDGQDKSAVLTFDDITELQSAQRKAAWSDVARRIAHEIKNPLTPIQLSAERLKRKYLKQITEDRDIFAQCTDTIIHHVDDIGRMVNEFSDFARMPEPVMKEGNLGALVQEIVVLRQQAHPEITFAINSYAGGAIAPFSLYFDARQIRQALTNIIQNAIDSIHGRQDKERKEGAAVQPGAIEILVTRNPERDEVLLTVIDNGAGLPAHEAPERLSEPYVTHKPRGTGLGLAIVKKIMEDHHGRLVIGAPEWLKAVPGWRGDLTGASVSLTLPVDGMQGRGAGDIEPKKAIS